MLIAPEQVDICSWNAVWGLNPLKTVDASSSWLKQTYARILVSTFWRWGRILLLYPKTRLLPGKLWPGKEGKPSLRFSLSKGFYQLVQIEIIGTQAERTSTSKNLWPGLEATDMWCVSILVVRFTSADSKMPKVAIHQQTAARSDML